jgi:hypothetical protein
MSVDVDVVIAIHDPARAIDRAVRSVLDGIRAEVRVTVVAHNTAAGPIRDRLHELAGDPRLRFHELQDGIRSPSGPFNAGLDLADAAYTAVMGSDDELEPGAVDSWLALARRERADVVIARLRRAGARPIPTPPTRPFRTRGLDGVRDRLSYRSAPLGLVSTNAFPTLRFTPGRPVGEDVPYVTRLWFSGARICYDRSGPAYLVHDDAPQRMTLTPRPVEAELAYLSDVLGADWFARIDEEARAAFCVKAMRIHLFGAVHNRPDPSGWTRDERVSLADTARALIAAGGGIERALSRRDRTLLDAILDPATPAEDLLRVAASRRRFGTPGTVLPRRLRDLFHREAPPRMMAASALQLL